MNAERLDSTNKAAPVQSKYRGFVENAAATVACLFPDPAQFDGTAFLVYRLLLTDIPQGIFAPICPAPRPSQEPRRRTNYLCWGGE